MDSIYNEFLNGSITVHGDVLQLLLYYAGYSPGTIDGVVGQKTANAIYNFQQDQGLHASGNWDDDTIQYLKQMLWGAG